VIANVIAVYGLIQVCV